MAQGRSNKRSAPITPQAIDVGGVTLRSVTGGVEFDVRVAPRASRSAWLGVHAGALKVSLTAPPVDGAANAALIAWFADTLGVAKSAIAIVRGEHVRNKSLRVTGLSLEQLRAALAALFESRR